MLKLKTLITEQEFKAKSKETGRVVVYKSKDSMDKAIKGGRAEPLDKKTSDKPEKAKGASLFKKDKPKSEPKKVPPRKGPEGMQGTKDTLAKSLQTGLNPYQHSGLVIQVLDFVGDYPELTDRIEKLNPPTSIGKSDAQYQKELDAFRETENELRNDIIKALSDKPKEPEEPYDLSDFDPREDVKENKMKLKSLLKEAQVWERKFGEPLPTFSSVMEKHSGKKIDEQGVLSRRAGINVFGDKKLELIAKSLIHTAKDLHHTAKRKDEKNFDDVLSRITISLGVIRSYLNKPKRSM